MLTKNWDKNVTCLTTLFLFILSIALFSFTSLKQNNDFDNIIIYRLKQEKRSQRSNTHSLSYKIIHGSLRSGDIKDGFEKNLRKFGYVKNDYNKIKHDQICDKIKSFVYGKSKYETSCLQTYRDIFIYKKQEKIVKVIKICTSCYANEVITPESESELLMDFKDYDSLKELIEE